MKRRQFADSVFDVSTGEIVVGSSRIRLSPKEARVLQILTDAGGSLVDRREIIDSIWGDAAIVTKDALNAVISRLRHTLGDTASDPRFIATVPGRGYRFLPDVHEEEIRAPREPDCVRELVVLPVESLSDDERALANAITRELTVALAARLGRSVEVIPFELESFEAGRPGSLASSGRIYLGGRLEAEETVLRLRIGLAVSGEGASIWAESFASSRVNRVSAQATLAGCALEGVCREVERLRAS